MIKTFISAIFILFGIVEYILWWGSSDGQMEKLLLKIFKSNNIFLRDPYVAIYFLIIGLLISRNIKETFRDNILNRVPSLFDNRVRKIISIIGIILVIFMILSLYFIIGPLFLGESYVLASKATTIFWVWIICPLLLKFFIYNLPHSMNIQR
jgi:hypothetical protein